MGCVVGLAAAGGISALPILTIPVLLGFIGLLDDVRSLPAGWRLLTQAAVALTYGFAADLGVWPGPVLLVGVLSTVWIIGIVNTINFMDGINGISAVSTTIMACTLAFSSIVWGGGLTALSMLALAGACLGFLPFNFPTPKLFLGDVGSYFIGGLLSVASLELYAEGAPLLPIALCFVIYVGDVGATLVARLSRGQPILESHRDHAYQRLANGGLGHTKATLIVAAAISACVAIGLLSAQRGGISDVLAALGAIGIASVYLALPHLRALKL